MSADLATFQGALAKAVRGVRLAEAEADALGALVTHPGLRFTSVVRRSWCEGRTAWSAPLTLSALPIAERRAHVQAWVEAGGGTAWFFHAEVQPFLQLLLARLPPRSHAAGLCRLEQALNTALAHRDLFRAGADKLRAATMLRRHHAAALVGLFAPIEVLAAALEEGGMLPPVADQEVRVLVGPGLPEMCRSATAAEAALWEAAAGGVRAGRDLDAARALVSAGVLVVESAGR